MESNGWLGALGLILMFGGFWIRIRILTRENETMQRHIGNIWVRLRQLEQAAVERAKSARRDR